MPLSLSRLQTLLREVAKKREEGRPTNGREHADTRSVIQKVWQAHGMVLPWTGSFVRPIPYTLFQCPDQP
jgi:hypothetical protein